MAKTTAKSLVLSAEEEALVVAFRNLIGSAVDSEAQDAEDDGEDVEDAEDEDDEEEGELEAPDREEVEGLGIKELRELAKEYGIDATKKAEILEAFEEFYDEDSDEDEDDVEDEDDEDGDEGEWDRESLEELSLKELRAVAKEEGIASRGLDQDALVDAILGEDEDADEEDAEDEDEEDDVEELDEDALAAMTHKELLGLAKELDIKVPAKLKTAGKGAAAKKTHAALVEMILDSGEEEDE